jgi:hypothetical protein
MTLLLKCGGLDEFAPPRKRIHGMCGITICDDNSRNDVEINSSQAVHSPDKGLSARACRYNRDTAAQKLESEARGLTNRELTLEELGELEKRTRSALKIQAVYRGYVVRKQAGAGKKKGKKGGKGKGDKKGGKKSPKKKK